MAEIEVIGSESTQNKITSKYLDFQLGFITEFITPVDHSLLLSDAVAMLKRDEAIPGLAVEDMDKVIGVLSREHALEKGHSALETLKGKSVKSYVEGNPVRFDASDFCENAFYQILKMTGRQVDSLIINEGTHFLGIIPINRLISHVSRIREMSYQQAHYIQQFFLDKSVKKTKGILFKDYLKMAHQIGGDFYHIREISPGKYLFACFDVANKDIAASLTTGLLSSFFTMYFSFEKGQFSPERMIQSLNQILVEQTPEDIFVVAIFLYFDLEQKVVKIYNHGYSPLYVLAPKVDAAGKVYKVNPGIMPLGINTDLDLAAGGKKMTIVPGNKFFLYSDGLLDGIDHSGVRFGEKRIQSYFMSNIKLKPDAFIEGLLAEYNEHIKKTVQVDDLTIIMMEVE